MSIINKSLLHVRMAQYGDMNAVLDIDIKSFDEAWSSEAWNRVYQEGNWYVSVVTYFSSPVGFAAFRVEGSELLIEKIAVKHPFRRCGASLLLVASGNEIAHRRQCKAIAIVVRESSIYPGEDSLLDWLKALALKATTPFLKDHFNSYGDLEDGVKCVASLTR